MDYWKLENNIGKKVSLNINTNFVIAKIENCEDIKGEKWVTFSVEPDYRKYTPSLYGFHIGNFNCLYYPVDKRTYKGWFSDEVFRTLKILN